MRFEVQRITKNIGCDDDNDDDDDNRNSVPNVLLPSKCYFPYQRQNEMVLHIKYLPLIEVDNSMTMAW